MKTIVVTERGIEGSVCNIVIDVQLFEVVTNDQLKNAINLMVNAFK